MGIICFPVVGNRAYKNVMDGFQLSDVIFTSSSAIAERPRNESAILSGWVSLRLNFRLNEYAYNSCQYLWTVGWESGYTKTLRLEVFTRRNFVADFIRLVFTTQTKKSLLSQFLGDLGATYALHL